MTSSKQVSVITINYNNAVGLTRTINSVLSQTFVDYEFVVVDGLSSDESISILEKFRSKISHCLIEKDQGIYDAMNKGINASCGEWIVFINSGDEFYSESTLDLVSRNMESGTDFLYGDVLVNYPNGMENLKKANSLDLFWRKLPFSHQTLYCRSEYLKNIGFNKNYEVCADFDFGLKNFVSGANFKHINKPLAIIEAGGKSEQGRFKIALEVKKISIKHVPSIFHNIYFYCFAISELFVDVLKQALPNQVIQSFTRYKNSLN